VSIDRVICHVVTRDACGLGPEYHDGGYTPHFDTADAALAAALDLGWRLDSDGAVFCNNCLDIATCLAEGHDYGPWEPCWCHGRLPDHALGGFGLFRTCRRDGCGDSDFTDLAHLPTTDEPTRYGR
jgi:hypothetical protein